MASGKKVERRASELVELLEGEESGNRRRCAKPWKDEQSRRSQWKDARFMERRSAKLSASFCLNRTVVIRRALEITQGAFYKQLNPE